MDTSLQRSTIGKRSVFRQPGRRRPIFRLALAGLAIGAAIAATPASAPDAAPAEAQQRAACAGEQWHADCPANAFMVWDHVLLERVSRMFPTQGV